MHPQIRLDKPGLCPICHMELTPLHTDGADSGNSSAVTIDPVIMQNMGLRTLQVEQGELRQVLRAVGTLTEPEQNHLDINLRVSGWIQKLHANQEGMAVAKGDPLFDLYSPEITAAADEFIAARKSIDANSSATTQPDPLITRSNDVVLAAGRRKLEFLGLSTAQIDAIAKLDKAPPFVTITAPIEGHIATKNVIEGSNVMAGQRLMEIANRSSMWLMVQVYEQQLGLVTQGQKAHISVPATPGKSYEGTVDFVYPHLDTATRTATVRVVLDNHDHRLHENMYATAELDVSPTAASVLVPREAVIDSGLRQIVFIAEGAGRFSPRQVTIGRSGRKSGGGPEGRAGGDAELVQILSGLSPGETVVTSGQFLLDSESRMQEATQKFLAAGTPGAQMAASTQPVAPQADLRKPANPQVTAVIRAYLPMASFFGAPQKNNTPVETLMLERAAAALQQEADSDLKNAGRGILEAVTDLNDQPIEIQREKFKALSKAVVRLATSQPLAAGFGTVYVFECPMDNSQWLQQTPTPANPFFPVDMKTCGEKKQSLVAPATEEGK